MTACELGHQKFIAAMEKDARDRQVQDLRVNQPRSLLNWPKRDTPMFPPPRPHARYI